jgi:hypothetical protein
VQRASRALVVPAPVGQTGGMLALSAVVFAIAWWLGLYLAARDHRKPVLRAAATGLVGYALAVAVEAVRLSTAGTVSEVLGAVELYLLCVPGLAWLLVLLGLRGLQVSELSAATGPPGRPALLVWPYGVVVATIGVTVSGGVGAPAGVGHVLTAVAIAVPLLAAVTGVLVRGRLPARAVVTVATLFFALGVAALLLPLGLVPSWLALASIGCDLALLGLAVAVFDAFDEGQSLPHDMRRSLLAAAAVSVLFGGQVGLVLVMVQRSPLLVAVLFGSIAAAVALQVLATPLAGLLDRLAFAATPALSDDRARLRDTAEALPRRTGTPVDAFGDEEFARLTRRALSHYGNLSRLVASPLVGLPAIDARLAERGAPDQPLERAAELKLLLAESIARLRPRDGGEFGTSDEWRHYNALHFPYVVGLRPYARLSTPAGLDPVARRAWQWFTTSVPQRSLHNWQNAAARLVAADLRARSDANA